MIRTLISILVTLLMLLALFITDLCYVQNTFTQFHDMLQTLFEKTETQTATYQDGEITRNFWESKRKILHVWLPHASIQEIDLQLNEAIGYLYQENYEDSLAKIETLICISYLIPDSYTLKWKNIL
jgi:hypothetical protein